MLLPLVRGLFVASLLSSFGAALFLRVVLPRASPRIERHNGAEQSSGAAAWSRDRASRWLCSPALPGSCSRRAPWPRLTGSPRRSPRSQPSCSEPGSAKCFCSRGSPLVGAGAALALFPQRSALPAGLAATATLLEAGHSHAFAMSHAPNLLLLSQALHLLAGGAWLGGLLPLLIVVRQAPLDAAQDAAGRFSTLGAICVALLIATALYQGVLLSGGLAGLTGTAYGAMLLTKAALFALLIGIAAINRLRLAPALAGPTGEGGRRALCLSIALETAIGLAVVLAASVLAGLEPGMHMALT